MACTEVIDPFLVVVMRSCMPPMSVASVGWYPTAEGIRPSRADTSEPFEEVNKCAPVHTCLRESKNVVDEQEHVLAFLVPEIFCHSQTGQRHSRTSTRRLVHLTKHEGGLALPIHFDHPSRFHLMVQIVALPRPLPDLCEGAQKYTKLAPQSVLPQRQSNPRGPWRHC